MSGTGFYTRALNGVVQRDWKGLKSLASESPFMAGANAGAAGLAGYNMFSGDGSVLGGAVKGAAIGGSALMGWKNRAGIMAAGSSVYNGFKNKNTYDQIWNDTRAAFNNKGVKPTAGTP